MPSRGSEFWTYSTKMDNSLSRVRAPSEGVSMPRLSKSAHLTSVSVIEDWPTAKAVKDSTASW